MYILAKIETGAGEFERQVTFQGYRCDRRISSATVFMYRTDTRFCARLEDLWVHVDERGKGYGARIMHEVFEYLALFATRHRACVYLQFTSNPRRIAANALYQRLGCTLIAQAVDEAGGTNLYQKIFLRPREELRQEVGQSMVLIGNQGG